MGVNWSKDIDQTLAATKEQSRLICSSRMLRDAWWTTY